MLGQYGETLVVDWGLAKAVGRRTGTLESDSDEKTLRPSSGSMDHETLPGSTVGTPGYMSPEQAAGRLDRLGPPSDVYSLGATLYCLLTGRQPFEGKEIVASLEAVQQGDFPAPRAIRADIPPALEAVALKAMALRPDDRYGSARACLKTLSGGWPTSRSPHGASPGPFEPAASWRGTGRRSPPRRPPWQRPSSEHSSSWPNRRRTAECWPA